MKDFFSITRKIYNFKIIGCFFIIFFALRVIPIGFIPDYLNISGEVETKRVILIFISSLTGFLSLILAVFIVFYNFFSQSIRRNAVSYILDNIWLKRLISFYLGTIAFLLLTYFSVGEPLNHNDLNLLYCSILLFVVFILFAFPVIMLSIKYSSSLQRVKELTSNISIQTIDELNAANFDNNLDLSSKLEQIESNDLILIKDIGVDAINKSDWNLPQNIVIELYNNLIKSIDVKVKEEDIYKRIDGFLFVINHFTDAIIKSGDSITIKVIIDHLIQIHKELNDKSVHLTLFKRVNETTRRLFHLVVKSGSFDNIQNYLLHYASDIILIDFSSFKASDDELLLLNYRIEMTGERGNSNQATYTEWHYLINDVSDIFFEEVMYAIQAENEQAYKSFDLSFQILLGKIMKLDNLTEYQKEEVLIEYYVKGRLLIDLLIEKKLYKKHNLYAIHDIVTWLENNERFAINALSSYTQFIDRISKLNVFNIYLLYGYFQMTIDLIKSNSLQKIDAIDMALDCIKNLYDKTEKNSEIRKEIISYLKRLSSMVEKSDDEEIKSIFNQKTKGIKLNKN